MKKILTVVIAIAFLAGPALAAQGQAANDAAKGAQDQKRVEESHTHGAKKKSKKAKKAKKAQKEPTNATRPEPPTSESGTSAR